MRFPDLQAGIQLDTPAVWLAWETAEADLPALLGPALRTVGAGHYVLPEMTALGGLRCGLALHYRRPNGTLDAHLTRLEFFRTAAHDPRASFDEIQRFFEQAFGLPTAQGPALMGFPSYRWELPGAVAEHYWTPGCGASEQALIRRQL